MHTIQHIPSPNYYAGRQGQKLSVIVIHSMEASERLETAENVARWFAQKKARASAHVCIDTNSIVTCVAEHDTAWHAPGLQRASYGIEHAGYARQTPREWLDPYGVGMLRRSAEWAATLAHCHNIRPLRLIATDLRTGKRYGFTGHADVSDASGKSDHWDPGPGFPWNTSLALVAAHLHLAAGLEKQRPSALDRSFFPSRNP